jgi:hypothetical protein
MISFERGHNLLTQVFRNIEMLHTLFTLCKRAWLLFDRIDLILA